ncbi:hypothetical protein U5801_15720 [Lamprobacter modestohalophilus]|uniref:hypothetical protein n=1 Tax=Lamprobacter modestohalophilus TaxID=1064514 RepID=UPI002ADEABCB|nr:hypothetical protein [Lamprobacter modestohalophilus]MEA1051242.1 hypothetical protein [Lamprobacter modestohalophilus]
MPQPRVRKTNLVRLFAWCQGRGLPIAFVLAGGYIGRGLDQRGLVDLHRLTLFAAARIKGFAR